MRSSARLPRPRASSRRFRRRKSSAWPRLVRRRSAPTTFPTRRSPSRRGCRAGSRCRPTKPSAFYARLFGSRERDGRALAAGHRRRSSARLRARPAARHLRAGAEPRRSGSRRHARRARARRLRALEVDARHAGSRAAVARACNVRSRGARHGDRGRACGSARAARIRHRGDRSCNAGRSRRARSA